MLSQQQLCKVLPWRAAWDCESCPQEEEVWAFPGSRDRRPPRPACLPVHLSVGCPQWDPTVVSGCLPSIQGQETLKGGDRQLGFSGLRAVG